MVGMSQEQSALFWQSLTWKFVLRSGLVKESICHTSPSLLQTWGETCRRVGVSAYRRIGVRLENAFAARGGLGRAPRPPVLRLFMFHGRATPVARERATLPNARERVSDVRYADTPRRPHADTSPLAWRPRLALFIVKHVFAFWRFVSGCNLG
jgi:hypothetical protein